MRLKGAFNCVPKGIAPNKDPGIYFTKAIDDLEYILEKYRKLNGD